MNDSVKQEPVATNLTSVNDDPMRPQRDYSPEELLVERERAIQMLSFLPETKTLTLYCQRTGVAVATFNLLQQAGKLPYLTQWKESQALHPLFSLPQAQLLAWTRKNWNTLFRGDTIDRTTEVQRQQFCIAFLAILHSLKCIDQQVPALPNFNTVNTNMQRLLELAYWFNFLDSKKFKFPTLRISKLNSNTALSDIGTYLDICESCKHDYEISKDAQAQEAKLEAAQRAEKAVRGSHVKAVSKKALWNWFMSSLAANNSKKYELPEWQEWKETSEKLWFANENQQLQYALDDVDSIEEVFILECSLGTIVSHAFKSELQKIRSNIHNHLKVFEIDWVATMPQEPRRVSADGVHVNAVENVAPPAPGEEPQLHQFFNRTDYIRAHAKWKVAGMQYAAWQEKYGNKGNDNPQTPSAE